MSDSVSSGLPRVVEVALPRPSLPTFLYAVPELPHEHQGLQRGSIVEVPFGRQKLSGVVTHSPREMTAEEKEFLQDRLKPIERVIESQSYLSPELFDVCAWVSKYYLTSLGEALSLALPRDAFGSRPRTLKPFSGEFHPPVLNDEQQKAVREFQEGQAVHLLHGVTGSGKTEVYLNIARKVLDQGHSVLLLVPEISLTPQLHQRIERGLGERVALWHSSLPKGQRRDFWHALYKGEIRVLVGARSAIFAPMKNLGLVILDEEHDPTYKQEERCRYHVRDVALQRVKRENARLLLGSATPSLEVMERVHSGGVSVSHMRQRYQNRPLPQIEVIDLGQEELRGGLQAPFAERTLKAIQETLDRKEQVLIYLNRRGFSAMVWCEECRGSAECPECSVPLTHHASPDRLVCHYCGYSIRGLPVACSHCGSTKIKKVGAGTESLELELPPLFRGMHSIRLDRDQITSHTRLTEVLDQIRNGEVNTVMGTQMLVKGHDFPAVTLVVVVLADALFRFADFRAPERAFQTLTQVAGRAGRASSPGRVLIQTFEPEHPVLKILDQPSEVEAFYASESHIREAAHYPPFWRWIRFRLGHRDPAVLAQFARDIDALKPELRARYPEIEILGPVDPLFSRIKGEYRKEFFLRAQEIEPLHRCAREWASWEHFKAKNAPQVSIDVDPISVL